MRGGTRPTRFEFDYDIVRIPPVILGLRFVDRAQRLVGFHIRRKQASLTDLDRSCGIRDPGRAMKKKRPSGKSNARKRGEPAAKSRPNRRAVFVIITVAVVASLGAFTWMQTKKSSAPKVYVPRPRGQLTFNKDIAPIVFQQCAVCHRPGQSAPFQLLNYTDVRKHAHDIAKVTANRYMPPWLPEPGYGEFVGERRLSADEIGMIQQWVAEGAAEGAPSDLPSPPKWSGDWQLGPPDLILTMPEPFTLPAEGRDVYRNFVIPVLPGPARFVKGVEFHPGNPKVVHHTFIRVDSTGQSRRLDAQDAEPGFGGMISPAKMPGGHFLGWQPGRMAEFLPDGLAWRLNPGDDLVVEMHMNPSGKPEQIQSSIGLYFTDRPPTNTCFKIALTSYTMEIPAGAEDYVVEDSFRLPVDVQALAVLPHAHYLAKEMKGWATLPDGTKRWLLFIKQWDFNWQGDYRYTQPIFLAKGSVLSMRFTYDNSTNNVRNPNSPPKPVNYGLQTSDEMAELWLQLLPRNAADLAALDREYQKHVINLFRERDEFRLRKDPNDAEAHMGLGLSFLNENNMAEAERHFRAAVQAKPDLALAHRRLAVVLRLQKKLSEARAQFEETLRLDPQDFQAHGNLGFVLFDLGDPVAARAHFEAALRLNPDDPVARDALNEMLKARGQSPDRR